MAIASFANSVGAALTISVGQNILVNGLRQYIPRYTTGVDTEAVVAAGAGDVKDLVPQGQLLGLRQAYARSLDHTFAFAVAAAGLAVGFALLVGPIPLRLALVVISFHIFFCEMRGLIDDEDDCRSEKRGNDVHEFEEALWSK